MTVTYTHAPGTFCWADLGTPDAAAAKRFYTGLFGWHYDDRPAGPDATYTMFDLGGKAVAALYQQDPHQLAQGVPPHWLSYLSVESADDTAQRTRGLGGTVIMDPFDVLDVGRMALIQDPTGAVVALWEPRRHVGAGVVGEPSALCWNELATTSVAQAGAFYSGLLGWAAEPQRMGTFTYTYFRKGERSCGGMMQIRPEWGPVPPHWLVYFAVDDCDERASRAQQLGGRLRAPPSDVPEVGRFAVVQDPHGAVFAIIKVSAEC
jgi:predicted enzyme related to lactoylglutathione lyase